MVGYELGKTVTDNGSVARGVCQVNEEGYLDSVVERTKIEKQADGVIRFTEDGKETESSAGKTSYIYYEAQVTVGEDGQLSIEAK